MKLILFTLFEIESILIQLSSSKTVLEGNNYKIFLK
jgi:hypothetical protein